MANVAIFKARRGEAQVEDAVLVPNGAIEVAAEVAKLSEKIRAAIESGDVIARKNEVTRKVEGKKYRKEYLQLVPINSAGMFALANGVESTWSKDAKTGEWDFDGPCMVKDFFYGNDLGTKSKESQRLAVLVEGPDKAKQAAAKQLAKAFGILEEAAMAKILAMGD